MRRRIALCGTDLDYARRMAAYVRESRFRGAAEIVVFQKPEALAASSGREPPDVIVLDAAFASWSASLPDTARIVWLGEDDGETGPDGVPMMSKYEPASRLLDNWLRTGNRPSADTAEKCTNAAVVAVWSSCGGVGKTTVASMLADLWLHSKRNVFLIGFDPGTYRLLHRSPVSFHDLGDWLFAIKSGRSVERFEPDNDTEGRLHLFLPGTPLQERINIGSGEGKRIIETASARFGCDAVIVDAETGWSAFAAAALHCADAVVWLDADDEESLRKSEVWLGEWPEWLPEGEWIAKTLFVLNKCLHAAPAPDTGTYAPNRALRFPYVPEWKQDKQHQDPLFAYPLQRLSEEVRALCSKRGR